MVAKFLNDNKSKRYLNSRFALLQTSSIIYNFIQFVTCWRNFLGWIRKARTSMFRKRKFLCCAHLLYWKFHVAVVQQWLRNVQKSVMHVQRCSFANLNLLLFAVAKTLLLWSRNFATKVTWRHTSLLYCIAPYLIRVNTLYDLLWDCVLKWCYHMQTYVYSFGSVSIAYSILYLHSS